MTEELQWWGYIHKNGSTHLKRFFSDLDIQEAKESPFVREVFGPWEAADHEKANAVFSGLLERRK